VKISTPPLVFDTGPLRHFALQGWLGPLRFITKDREVVIPESVEAELRRQAEDLLPMRMLLDTDWIHVDRSDDIPFLAAFARYEQRLVADGQNIGECGVLALGATRGWEMVLDDSTPRAIADEEGLAVTVTVQLLCDAIRAGMLTVPMTEQLADELIMGKYYLPFGRGGFRLFALQQGLIDY
jgi:predicted nucleic acid-binding protein